MSLMKFVWFSVTLKASSASSVSSKPLDCFCCAKKAAYHEADYWKKKRVASFIGYQYKREVYYKRTL